ncbi:MAG: hypothetical protein ACI83L_002849, partial [Cryomorphaceae bacterium]
SNISDFHFKINRELFFINQNTLRELR